MSKEELDLMGNYVSPEMTIYAVRIRKVVCESPQASSFESFGRSAGEWDDESEDD